MLDLIHPDLRHLAVPIDELNEDPKNANAHSERNLASIAESFKRFGQRKPIVVRREGMLVEAGNGTLASLRAEGWTHLACIVCDDDEQTATAYGLVDNQSARLAEWNPDALRERIDELTQGGYDVQGLGWNADEIVNVLAGNAQSLVDRLGTNEASDEQGSTPANPAAADDPADDEIPDAPAEPITQPGEVIEIGKHVLHCADCMDVLRSLPDNSVDAIVTDPPYGLSPDGRARTWDDIEALRQEGKGPKAGFLGNAWDAGVPGVTWARECLRVLKPGGHLIAHSATRTYHRLACAVEDAGFEIRDMIPWLYYQGVPKSLDVSKSIDKLDAGEEQESRRLRFTAWVRSTGITSRQIDEATGTNMGGHYTTAKSQPAIMTREHLNTCRHLFADVPEWVEREADIRSVESRNFAAREKIGEGYRVVRPSTTQITGLSDGAYDITAPATEDARKWDGWGTALKSAIEPTAFARKPLSEPTVAANVLKWGTGAININACRMEPGDRAWPGPPSADNLWPANIYACAKPAASERHAGMCDDTEGHVTVKPVKLYRWFLRLVTPPGGTVLETFGGSGTTPVAAEREGFKTIIAEREPKYCDIIRARLTHAVNGG